jgi:hypothetical protein
MRLVIFKILLSLSIILLVSGCSTKTNVDRLNSAYQAKDKNCEIQFFKNGDKPRKNYEEIGKIESHIKKNFFFGGQVQLEDEAFKELRIKACGLGGDAVIIDDCIETSVSEMSHVHVWGTVIKYSN